MNADAERTEAHNSCWRLRSDVAVVTEQERVTVLALEPIDAVPMELAGPGLDIWNLIDGRRDLAKIIEQLSDTYNIEADALFPDVVEFLEQLETASILERIDY